MIFTSEQVSMGHPDKICDKISDAILTDCLRHDASSRVAVETLIKDDKVVVAGEITTNHDYDVMALVKSVLEPLGILKFNLIDLIGKQSNDIAQGVDSGGAGDQGLMFGYATNETDELLPLPYVLATQALIRLKHLNHPLLGLDAKAQVSYDYDKNRIDTFLISTQHKEEASLALVTAIVSQVMLETARAYHQNKVRYDLTPQGIIKELDLLNVDYTKTTCYGHFGKKDLPWEV